MPPRLRKKAGLLTQMMRPTALTEEPQLGLTTPGNLPAPRRQSLLAQLSRLRQAAGPLRPAPEVTEPEDVPAAGGARDTDELLLGNSMKGAFIVVEGIEGGGKSTCIRTIGSILQAHGISDIVYTREPGGTALAEKLRAILLDPVEKITPEAELLLMYASRTQLVQTVIRPALEEGAFVIGDRHDLSSLAYQGGGRGMDRKLIAGIRSTVLGDFGPDLTILLDIEPELGLSRVDGRGGGRDRFEKEKIDFFRRVRNAYLQEAAVDPKIAVVDASGDLDTVTDDIRRRVEDFLCSRG